MKCPICEELVDGHGNDPFWIGMHLWKVHHWNAPDYKAINQCPCGYRPATGDFYGHVIQCPVALEQIAMHHLSGGRYGG